MTVWMNAAKELKLIHIWECRGLSGKVCTLTRGAPSLCMAWFTHCSSPRIRPCGEGSHTALEGYQSPSALASPSQGVTSRNSLFTQSQSDKRETQSFRLNHFLSPQIKKPSHTWLQFGCYVTFALYCPTRKPVECFWKGPNECHFKMIPCTLSQ